MTTLRVIRWALMAFATLGGIVVGTAGAALGTGAGRDVLIRTGLSFANRALRGTVTIASYDGPLFGGLEVRGVRIVGEDGAPLLEADALEVRYRVGDFLSRRVVLGQLLLTRPRVTLTRRGDERWNIEQIFGLGEGGGGGGGPEPLVAFRDVVVRDAIVTMQQDDDLRTIEIPSVLASYVRLASPFTREDGIRVDLARARATVSNPALDVYDARGRLDIVGDSVAMDLTTFRLRNTVSPLRGYLRTGGTLTFDLSFVPEMFSAADVQGLVPALPVGVVGTGEARVAFDELDVLTFVGDRLDLVTANTGQLRGRLGFVVGPGKAWRADRVDVTTDGLDLDYIRPFIDSIPFAGRVTGRTAANGPSDRLAVTLDWLFADDRAAGAVTTIAGGGVVALGVPGDAVLEEFVIDSARIALATIRVLVPAMALRGTLEGTGSLNGPWKNAEFAGELRHTDGDLPTSIARGRLRIDSRADVTGFWATLDVDSLQFDGIRPSYPAASLAGGYRGHVAVSGFMDSMAVRLDLSGPAGAVTGGGIVTLAAPRLGVADLDISFRDLTLAAFRERFPRTRLAGRAVGHLAVDTLAAPRVDLAVRLEPSVIGSVVFDSAVAHVIGRDSLLIAQAFALWGPGVVFTGGGGLALAAPQSDTLTLDLRVDSLAAALPFFVRLAGRDPQDVVTDTVVAGAVTGAIRVMGALDRLAVDVAANGRRIRWNDAVIPVVSANGGFGFGDRTVAFELVADTGSYGVLGFSWIEARASGLADSMTWRARARLGPDAAFLAGGHFGANDSARSVRFDSLAVLLAGDAWFLTRGSSVALTDSAVAFHELILTTASGGSRIEFGGKVPLRGPGDLSVSVEGLQIDNLWALAQLDPDAVSGDLSGTLRLAGTARLPVIDGAVAMRNAVFNEFRAPITQGTLRYIDRRVDGTFRLWQAGAEILNVDVSLPMNLGLRDVTRRQLPGALTVRARADGVDLSFLSAIYPLIRRTSGRFWADLGVTGEWDRPELTGYLRIEDGAATIPALGVRHEGLVGALRLSADTIRVDSLLLTSGRGTAHLGGYVQLEGLTRPRLDLTLEARDFRAIDVPDFLTLTTSGSVQLTGPVFGARLTGEGTVTRGVIYFADILEKDIVSLEDSLLDSATVALIRRQGLGTAFQNRFLDSLRIENLALTMGSDVRLRSSEANFQLTGLVTVGKTGAEYRVDGDLATPRGTYSLSLGPAITKDFSVTRGEVRYFGTPDLNAALDIDARNQVRTVRGDIVRVFVHVGGTINAPTLTLSSDVRPPLSDTEIISYLVFGAPSAQAAGGQLQYGAEQSIASLAGRIAGQFGSNLIADLGIPVDYFEVRPSITGGLSNEIAVGWQIGERWFVTANQRLCPAQSFSVDTFGASLEFRMSQQWRLSASADPLVSCFATIAQPSLRYQFGVDLLWERSY